MVASIVGITCKECERFLHRMWIRENAELVILRVKIAGQLAAEFGTFFRMKVLRM